MSLAAYTLADACRGCGSDSSTFQTVLRMDPMPLAGEFPETRAEALSAERYPLTWVVCRACGLAQVLEDVPDKVLYSSYRYGSSTVPGLVHHFDAYADVLKSRFGPRGIRLLEIGCNDGVLLDRLPKGWTLVGVDPSDVAVRSSHRAYELIPEPFTSKLANSLSKLGRFDVVTASNALAHFTDLHGAIEGARRLLRDGGSFFIEVHDLDATLKNGQWDTIYHEHKVEWSAESLRNCVEPVGFEIVGVERLPLHGGLLRVEFRVARAQPTVAKPRSRLRSFSRLGDAYRNRRTTALYGELMTARGKGMRLSAYGAAGRANVWLNQLPELHFEYVLDASPLRAGRWIPTTAYPIVNPAVLREDPTDICLITAWNYAADVKSQHADYPGVWRQTFAA